MPTIKQLHKIWKTQFELFGGHGVPKQAYDGGTDGQGLSNLRHTDIPLSTSNSPDYTGVILGKIEFDSEKNELNILPNGGKE